MKINCKFKVLAVTAVMAASAPALAAIEGGPTGNGELLLNVRYYGGDSATSGGDDISGLFDLGFKMNDMIALNGQTGVSKSWDMTSGAYGASWNQLMSFVTSHGGDVSKIGFNVIALDSSSPNTTGGVHYLTTANVDSYPLIGNANVKAMSGMQQYVDANNSRGTHATDANGASTATPTDAPNSFFGAINGFGQGDTWITKAGVDTTQPLNTDQNFWLLTTSSTSSLAKGITTPFGVDLDQDGKITGNEFSKFNMNANGTLSFTSPVSAIPEADTWAMLLAGLGMLGAMVRRRTSI
ncbi:PEP-CTERM sorting domain-containing protein [Nitrosovibrio tenuis]|uniref:MYXO-CTERM domain-containing protein n=1 Tax=Nitrosovibrio tenuis TaxID=1233 RepID=A0A1H7LQY0_9PROT|nr:PEP-CTERM sorting domain-containing protein [Nitrosovibrio tenuis]SEL01353.1 MYXO-CTERM domain-containing protein [Nitrosovibrio tenuis]